MLIIGWHLVGLKTGRLVLVVGIRADEICVHIVDTALGVHQKLIWLTLDLYLLHYYVIDHVDRFAFFLIFNISLQHTFIVTKIASGFFQPEFLIFVILAHIELSVFVPRLKISFCTIHVRVGGALRQYFKTRLAS